MATFNHTRGDSPRTPCAKCALECGWTRDPKSGPGIATMPRPCVDNEQWGCTLEDLVAGDA